MNEETRKELTEPSGPARKTASGKHWDILAIAAILFLASYLFYPLFAKGFPAALDNPVRYAETVLFKKLASEQHWLNVWCPQSFAGYPLLLYHYQTGHWLTLLLALLPGIEMQTAYKLCMVLSLLFPTLVLYFVLKSKFGRLPALLATGLFFFDLEVSTTILNGMWNNYLSIGFLLLFLWRLDVFLETPCARKAVPLAFFLALTILTHFYAAIAAFVLLLAFFLANVKRKKGIALPLLGAAVDSFGLSLFYILPFLETSRWLVPVGTRAPENPAVMLTRLYPSMSLFTSLREGSYGPLLLSLPLVIVELVLIVFLLASRGRKTTPWFLPLSIFGILCFILWGQFWYVFPGADRLPLLNGIVGERFRIYVKLAIVLVLAGAAARALQEPSPPSSGRPPSRARLRKILPALMGIAALLFVFFCHRIHRERLFTSGQVPEMETLARLWDYLTEHPGEPGSRIVYQGTYGNKVGSMLNASHIFAVSGLYAPIPQVGGWNAQWPYPRCHRSDTNAGQLFGTREENLTPYVVAERMEDVNAGRIVTVSAKTRERLLASSLFDEEKSFGDFSILSLRAFRASMFRTTGAVPCLLTDLSPTRIEFTCKGAKPGDTLIIKDSYHPYWHAKADGIPIPLQMENGFMKLNPPASESVTIELEYNPRNYTALFVSLAVLILLTALLLI
jgi:hypothetical protein